jgi:hypothetical protein
MTIGSSRTFATLKRVFSLSLNRTLIQLASTVVLLFVSHWSTTALYEMSIGLSIAGVAFAVAGLIPMGLIAELKQAKTKSQVEFHGLLGATAQVSVIGSLFLLAVLQTPIVDLLIRHVAGQDLPAASAFVRVLTISLPVMTLTNVFAIALESSGKETSVTKWRIAQAVFQIFISFAVLRNFVDADTIGANTTSILPIAWGYLLSDALFLCAFAKQLSQNIGIRPLFVLSKRQHYALVTRFSGTTSVAVLFERARALLLLSVFAQFGAAVLASYTLGLSINGVILIPLTGAAAALAMDKTSERQSRSFPLPSSAWYVGATIAASTSFFVLYFFAGELSGDKLVVASTMSLAPFLAGLTTIEFLLAYSIGYSRAAGYFNQTQPIYWLIFGGSLLCVQLLGRSIEAAFGIYILGGLLAAAVIHVTTYLLRERSHGVSQFL